MMSKSSGAVFCNLAKFLTVNPCDFSLSLRGLKLELGFGRTLRKLLVLLALPLPSGLFAMGDMPDMELLK